MENQEALKRIKGMRMLLEKSEKALKAKERLFELAKAGLESRPLDRDFYNHQFDLLQLEKENDTHMRDMLSKAEHILREMRDFHD